MLVTADFPDVTNNPSTYISNSGGIAVGATTATVLNTASFNNSDFILLGVIGSEQTELQQITSITAPGTITFTPCDFSHAIDVTVTQIPYNQVEFYRSDNGGAFNLITTLPMAVDYPLGTPFFDTGTVSSSIYEVAYLNTYTGNSSGLSSPFTASGGITAWSLRGLQDAVVDQVNDPTERRVIRSQITRWINEAYAKAQRRLRMLDKTYQVSEWTPATTDLNSDGSYALPITGINGQTQTLSQVLKVVNGIYISNPIDIRDIDPTSVYIQARPFHYFLGNNITFLPSNGGVTVWYYPGVLYLVNDGDTLDAPFMDYSDVFINYCMYRFSLMHKPETVKQYQSDYNDGFATMMGELAERQVQSPQGVIQSNPDYAMGLVDDII